MLVLLHKCFAYSLLSSALCIAAAINGTHARTGDETTKSGAGISSPVGDGLGFAYSSDEGRSLDTSCLQGGKVLLSGGSSTVINLDKQTDIHTFLFNLGVNLDVKVSYDKFDVTDTAAYARYVEDTSSTQTYLYYQQMLDPVLSLQLPGSGVSQLNSQGKAALGKGDTKGAAEFRQTCGDKYVQSERLGASLYVAVKLKFDSATDKNTFNNKLDVKYASIVDVMSTIKGKVNKANIHGSLEIIIFQQGGTPESLTHVFGKSDKGFYVNTCSLRNVAACQSVLDSILSYAKNDFSKQLVRDKSNIPTNGYPVVKKYAYYSDLGINVGPSLLTDKVKTTRADLADMLGSAQNTLIMANALLSSDIISSIPSATVINNLNTAVNDSKNNIGALESNNQGIAVCYRDIRNCVSNADSLKRNLKQMPPKFLEDFADAYRYKDSDSNYVYVLPVGEGVYQLAFLTGDLPEDINVEIDQQKSTNTLKLVVNGSDSHYTVSGTAEAKKGSPDYFKGTLTVNKKPLPVTFLRIDNPLLSELRGKTCFDIHISTDGMGCIGHFRALENPSQCGGRWDFTMGIGDNSYQRVAPGQKIYTGCTAHLGHRTFRIYQSGEIQCKDADISEPCRWIYSD